MCRGVGAGPAPEEKETFLGVLSMDKKPEQPLDKTAESKSKSEKGILIFLFLAPLPLFVLYLLMLFLSK